MSHGHINLHFWIYGVYGSFIFRPDYYMTYGFMPFSQNMVHTFNQPTFKTLLGASKFFKNSWTCFSYIIPFKNIFRLPFPLKIVIFGSIFYPSIFDFSNVPIVKSYSLQLWLCPYTLQFRETMQGWWRFFLSVEYLNSHICKREKLFTSLAFQSQ